ncbi:uncharacterized protein [Spinacia oleracea]|uniref:Transposase MuDR plant domain-containing protein n=1 Tax=Spinacia oleracea TaxID=3562 RepID=A0ABM3R9C4_SPIOL|nr:uncharacterized protein LOC110791489 [Spinacia oleracea]
MGTYVPKSGRGNTRAARNGKGKGSDVISDVEDDEDSEDVDFEETGSDGSDEDSEDETDIGDFIVEEEGLEDLMDEIHEKSFEDCLDGSSKMDKNYKNGKYREAFLDVLKDYCIQEGFGLSVEKADSRRYTAVCAIEGWIGGFMFQRWLIR